MKTKLKNVPVGTAFSVWGRKWTVLDKWHGCVFVLAAEIECEMPFSDDGKNNFRESDIRRYLNEGYLEQLADAGADTEKDIFPLDVDLKCTFGQHEYSVCLVKAGLLTLEEYGRYFDIIPKIEKAWWWLATPWDTPHYSSNGSMHAWLVRSNGGYNGSNCSNAYGVRPVLTLNSDLLVECDDMEESENSLSEVSTQDLLDELCRRCEVKTDE